MNPLLMLIHEIHGNFQVPITRVYPETRDFHTHVRELHTMHLNVSMTRAIA